MICRMTGINCPYANEYGYCDSTACHNMDIVGNIIPKERPENISNSSIWVKHQSNWHTGTPTEEGWYLLYTSKPNASYHLAFYQFDHWFSTDEYCIIREDVIAWQKITPYEEN